MPLAKPPVKASKQADYAKGQAIKKMITKAQDVAKLEMVKILQGREVPQKDIIESGLLNVEDKGLLLEFGIEPEFKPTAERPLGDRVEIVSKKSDFGGIAD